MGIIIVFTFTLCPYVAERLCFESTERLIVRERESKNIPISCSCLSERARDRQRQRFGEEDGLLRECGDPMQGRI